MSHFGLAVKRLMASNAAIEGEFSLYNGDDSTFLAKLKELSRCLCLREEITLLIKFIGN